MPSHRGGEGQEPAAPGARGVPIEDLPLHAGASGEAVRDLQRRLAGLGYDVTDDGPGEYGPGTEAAVRRFQTDRGLRPDGVCGPQTWSALVEADYRLGDRLLYRRAPMLRGDDVADLQRRLGALGFDAGRIDGIFGDDTAVALSDFQRNAGITVDAICGPASVAGLERLTGRGPDDPGAEPLAQIRERDQLRHAPRTLVGWSVAVGRESGLDAVADEVARCLTAAGAKPLVLDDPDGSAQAVAANAMGAEVYVGLRVDPGREGCSTAFYAGYRYVSTGGRRLAELLQARLPEVLGVRDLGASGMALPVLRETRMPAVLCELGPPSVVVAQAAELAGALTAALDEWAAGCGAL